MVKGYKKCTNKSGDKFFLVELEIEGDYICPGAVLGIVPNIEQKCRTGVATVTKIHGNQEVVYSIFDPDFEYREGYIVADVRYNESDKYFACGYGIHFYLDKQAAIEHFNMFHYGDNQVSDAIVDEAPKEKGYYGDWCHKWGNDK